MIEVTDNAQNFKCELRSTDSKIVGDKLEVTLKDFTHKKNLNNTAFSFFKDIDKRAEKNHDDLIASIQKQNEGDYLVTAGNYVGKINWSGLSINIKSRFSDVLLKRMLNFANDVFLDDVQLFGSESKGLDVSKLIIYYLFIQSLEKAFLLGLPKSYQSIKHHDMKVKGKIDINRFIRQDIPFKGKIASVSREQVEIQEVIDVLYQAVKIIDKQGKYLTQNIMHIKTHLKQHHSGAYVSNERISKALHSKVLQNPIFAPYKKVLEYAKLIVNYKNIEESDNGKTQTFGFLINVAELFEIYVRKLLQLNFSDWDVDSPKILVYNGLFYERNIIPDIVMSKDNNLVVFDTKYKRMNFKGKDNFGMGDLDRADFFQINTYMSHYQSTDCKLLVGGLLYPIEGDFQENRTRCHSEKWFGNSETKFIVDGIELSDFKVDENIETNYETIKAREFEFIKRIGKFIGLNESYEK